MKRHIVILGNGVAGITAARFIRKRSDDSITVISSESEHFYARTALMYIFMGHLAYEDTKPYEDSFWAKNRIDLVRDHVSAVDTVKKRLLLADGDPIGYDVLVIATGSNSNRAGWKGQDLDGVSGLYSLRDLGVMGRWTDGISRAVVVGGGLIGVEMLEMLHSRQIPSVFLVREDSCLDYVLPAEESSIINEEIRSHGVDLRLATQLSEIRGDSSGRVESVLTSQGEWIDCQFVGLAVGVHPNVGFLKESQIEVDRGVLVNEFFETNVDDVYAIGDCAEFRDPDVAHRSIEQLWYAARKHGRTVARTITGERTAYDRGVFFNSAKFFTLEYQSYGDIRTAVPEDQESLIWVDAAGARLLRINFERVTRRVVGFNALGVRLRHEVCEHWIRSGERVEEVLPRLGLADFDPELGGRSLRRAKRTFDTLQIHVT